MTELKEEYFVWCQTPILFSEPDIRLKYNKSEDVNYIREASLYKMKDDSFVYIEYSGLNDERGTTLLEFFNEQNEAILFFEELWK